MTPEQFLSLDEIKRKCGISGTDLDGQLSIYREAAIGTIEKRTLRVVKDRPAVEVQSPDNPVGKDYVTFYLYDALPIPETTDVAYRTKQDDPGFARDGTLSIPAAHWSVLKDRVRVYNGTADGVSPWPERDPSVPFAATLPAGIPAGQAPPEFQAAALMLIREQHEGSLMDKLPTSILDVLLRDHVKPRLTVATERLIEAGID